MRTGTAVLTAIMPLLIAANPRAGGPSPPSNRRGRRPALPGLEGIVMVGGGQGAGLAVLDRYLAVA